MNNPRINLRQRTKENKERDILFSRGTIKNYRHQTRRIYGYDDFKTVKVATVRNINGK